jgi:bifunctional DNA primase/polymerase-like protein/primase-like protein
MTSTDYFPIFVKLFGPYCLELSKPPHAARFGDGSRSGNTTNGQCLVRERNGGGIIYAGPVEPLDLIYEEFRANGNGGDLRAIVEESSRRSAEAERARLIAENEGRDGYGFQFMRNCHVKGWTYEQARAAFLADKADYAYRPGESCIKYAWKNTVQFKPDSRPSPDRVLSNDNIAQKNLNDGEPAAEITPREKTKIFLPASHAAPALKPAVEEEEEEKTFPKEIAQTARPKFTVIPGGKLDDERPDTRNEMACASARFAAATRAACAVYAQTGKLLDAALAYAKYGIPVFPCDPVTKVPIPRRDPDPTSKFKRGIPGTGGVKKATTDPITITQWWTRNPNALIAVAMGPRSGVWACDVDTAQEHEHESVTAWDALRAEHEPFETREHRSASGGPHAFFKWKDGQPIGCSPGQLPKGISIKGEGGYVVAPPSVRKGRSYTVFRDIDPTDAPQWFIDMILAGRPTPTRDPKKAQAQARPPFKGTPQCDLDELAEAMRCVPNDDLPWEEWASWGLAIFAASGGGQRGLAILDEFSQRSNKYGVDGANHVDLRWYEMTGSPPDRTGANKIFKAARAHGWQPKLPAAPPTYASAEDSATTARNRMNEIARKFLLEVDKPDPLPNHSNMPEPPIAHAVRIDTGIGKTKIVIKRLANLLKQKQRCGHFTYFTPRHNLNASILEQYTEQGINARIYYGREFDDPLHPGQAMCLNLPAVRLAQRCQAEISATCCRNKERRCRLFEQCGFQRQLRDRDSVQVWIAATDMLFHTQKALGEPVAVIIDEELWQKGIYGIEANKDDYWVAIDSISNKDPPPKTPDNRSDYGDRELNFLHLRHQLASALNAHLSDGAVVREHFDALSLTATSCKEALSVEWARYTADLKKLGQHPGMSDTQLTALAKKDNLIDRIQHTRHMIQIWEGVRDFLNRADIEVSGRLTLAQHKGQRVVQWRGIKKISAQFTVPTLLLDATLPALPILQLYHPRAEIVADIKVKLPSSVYIRQLLGAPTTARRLNHTHNLIEIRRYILARYLELNRPLTLVICQQKVEEWLKASGLPDDITIEHYKNITGLDHFTDVRLMLLIGRTAPSPAKTETITAALTGKCPPSVTRGSNGFRWYDQVERGIRLHNDSGISTQGDLHPDPDVEAVRLQIHEAELVQAFGRARAVNRTPSNPLNVNLLFNTCLPITIDAVERWQPPSLLFDTAINGVMLTAECDLMKLWPQLWPNRTAATRTLQQGIPPLPNFKQIEYQLAEPKMKKRVGYFDLALIPDPKEWLETQLRQALQFYSILD